MSADASLGSGLQSEDMPAIQRAADRSSGRAQKSYLVWTRIRLIFVVVAAIVGVVRISLHVDRNEVDIAAAVAVICFIVALVAEVYLLASKPEQTWYHGRAVAESVKTLTWRYVMRADRFAGDATDREIDSRLLKMIRDIIIESPIANEIELTQGGQITDRMKSLRSATFETRRDAYLTGRIDDQINWYSGKATFNRQRAMFWRWVMLVLEFGGIIGALLLFGEITTISVDGILASMIAGSGAWLEVKQFESLSAAYALTATELQLAREEGNSVTSEGDWSSYVNSAEEAISREHTMWLARRAGPRLRRG